MRSRDWFEPLSLWGIMHRGWMSAEGLSPEVFDGRPVVGICNSWSELNNCNTNLKDIAEAVKRGVWQAGGLPLEFPTISLGELMMKPTTMLYRNLMAIDVEECIVAHPLDSVVLLAGCDKTVPAQIMGAISANVPALMVTSGPMLRSNYRGRELGSGHSISDYLNEYNAGMISRQDLCEIETCISRSTGHCTVMGTASTMACLVEAMGFTLPGGAAIPGPDARRLHLAERAGRRAVAMAQEFLTPRKIITPQTLENAIRVLHAIGGSTNAVIHLIAFARRLGFDLPLEHFDRLAEGVPLLVNIMPSGKYGMENFHAAGGMQAVLKELAPILHQDVMTITGETMAQWLERAEPSWNRDIIYDAHQVSEGNGAIRMLRGTLCPSGALIKTSAASPHLMKHRGPAFVFDDYEKMLVELNDPELPVTSDHVLILKGGGPIGGPGMPEWGVFGIPLKLFRQGVRDVVRISDARASGTSHGTIVVHTAPEAAVGGPIGLVQTGDVIELDVASGRLDLLIEPTELEQRRKRFVPPARPERGYKQMYFDHVLQADQGVDFDFMTTELQPFPLLLRPTEISNEQSIE